VQAKSAWAAQASSASAAARRPGERPTLRGVAVSRGDPAAYPDGVPELTSVAVYRRTIRASLERIWENVLDWEHLPWLHRGSFGSIECLAAGDRGWRARIASRAGGDEMLIELATEPQALRYVARTVSGPGAGGEIWTRLDPVAPDATDIEVEFFAPDVAAEHADALGQAYVRRYTKLWDEDEVMMRHREAMLRARPATGGPGEALELGSLDELRGRLPLRVELGGRPFRVLDLDGELVVHSTVCPHLLGPLDEAELVDGMVTCPWHGYRFDPRSGRGCGEARRFRLRPAPRLEIDAGRVRLVEGASPA
jgi:nitrite reductase/ring-hydroxylating ferredoxin subunit